LRHPPTLWGAAVPCSRCERQAQCSDIERSEAIENKNISL
jgi:hypothetical protein